MRALSRSRISVFEAEFRKHAIRCSLYLLSGAVLGSVSARLTDASVLQGLSSGSADDGRPFLSALTITLVPHALALFLDLTGLGAMLPFLCAAAGFVAAYRCCARILVLGMSAFCFLPFALLPTLILLSAAGGLRAAFRKTGPAAREDRFTLVSLFLLLISAAVSAVILLLRTRW